MNVKSVIFACNHGRIGGDNISMLGAAAGLRSRGVNVAVIIPEKDGIENKLNDLDIKYVIIDHRIFAGKSKIQILITVAKFIFYILVFKADILHANDVFCNKYLSVAGKVLHKKIVCHVRFAITKDCLAYYLTPPPDCVIFNSFFMKNEFDKLKYKFKNRIEILYNPIEESNYYKPENRREMRSKWMAGDRFVVGIIGNISKEKGHLDYIEIANNLLKINKNFLFVIIGQDISNDKINLKMVTDLINNYCVNEYFVLHGVAGDVGVVLAGIDILLFPSHFESFGRVVIESILSKSPVVASRVGGMVETLEENPAAKLVDVGNIKGFVNAVLEFQMLSREKYNSLISEGKNMILENLSYDKSINNLLNIYKKL